MNTAIIIAGGCGMRMGFEVPKQFVIIAGKPIIVYTLEAFQNHQDIDSIGVVCLNGWHSILRDYAKKFGITKLDWVISGGQSAQESIFNGVQHLGPTSRPDDIVVIHDGIRPLIDADVISNVLTMCREYGNGVTSMPYNEQIFQIDDEDPSSTSKYIPRGILRRVATPQAYHYELLASRYQEAFDKHIGIGPSSYTNTMMVDLGERLYFATGSDKNIKLTTPDDLELFRARMLEKSEVGETDSFEGLVQQEPLFIHHPAYA